jgi:23S rRNA (adenine2030-N6)-methyltransferase
VLSYRHAYHAGNHADVLKHVVLVALLEHYAEKAKPLCYIDTHAGAGVYALDSPAALMHREFESGIGLLWRRSDLPESVRKYVGLVSALNPDAALHRYPGSASLARAVLPPTDKLWLCEMHPTDHAELAQQVAGAGIEVLREDGFARLRALLPPKPRRALVLIDPSYELKSEYDAVLAAVADAVRRFATGTYAIWYPMLSKREPQLLLQRLRELKVPRWLHAALQVRAQGVGDPGLHGSGMYVINPPYTLPAALGEALPYLLERLGQDRQARYTLEYEMP